MRERAVAPPHPLVEAWEWLRHARCRSRGIDFFDDTPELVALAKSVCSACPVREECRDYAVRAGETHGVWGGMSADELPRHRWLASWRHANRARREHTSRGNTA